MRVISGASAGNGGGTTEHGIVDARHQRCVSWQWWWKGNLFFLELLGSISQIQLVEHAMRPVTSQCIPILLTELLALGKKPMQIGSADADWLALPIHCYSEAHRCDNGAPHSRSHPLAPHLYIRLAQD